MSEKNIPEIIIDTILSTILDDIDLGIALIDAVGDVQWINQTMVNWFGTEEKLFSFPCVHICQDESYPLNCCISKLGNDLSKVTNNISHTYPDGSVRYFTLSTNLLKASPSEDYKYIMLVYETTELMQSKKTLLETEERFQTVIDSAPAGIVLTDLEGKIIYANQESLHLFGFDSQDEVVGLTAFDFLSDEEKLIVEDAIRGLLNGEIKQDLLTDMVKRDGSPIQTSVSLRALNDESGQPSRLLITIQDITENIRAEKVQEAIYQIASVAGSATKLEDIYSVIHEIILGIIPAQNFYIALNDRENHLIRFPYFVDENDDLPENEVPYNDKTITGYVLRTGSSLLCTKQVSNQLEKSGEVYMAGTEPEIWLGAPLIISGETIGVIAMQHYHDPEAFTERDQRVLEFVSTEVAKAIHTKRMDEALIESENRFRSVVESSPMGILIYHLTEKDELILLESNAATDEILGANYKKYIGRSIDEIFPNLSETNVIEIYRKIAASGGVWHSDQVDYVDKVISGAYEVFAFQISPQRVAVIYQDVTNRLKTEEEIRSLNEELEARVSQRTAELEAANREMEAFAYSVSHDLRAPVRSIKGFSELLQDEDTLNSPDAQDYLKRIYQSSIKMDKLIDDLLSLSYLENQTLNIRSVNLSEIAAGVFQQVSADYPQVDFTFEVSETPPIRADGDMVLIMLNNLIANACKFTANQPNPMISFGSKETNGNTFYYLKDNGIGFDMMYSEKIFAPFERLHPSDYEGTGIGLAIVRRVVQRHKGQVWATSALGEGTTFNFYFGTNEAIT